MNTKTAARIKSEQGKRFIVERTVSIRNAHGARKATGVLYEYTDGGRTRLQELDASLRDSDVVVDAARDAVGFYLDGDDEIEAVERTD